MRAVDVIIKRILEATPKAASNTSTAFVVAGHAFSLVFALSALHFTAEGIRVFFGEEWMKLGILPRFASLILDADSLVQTEWLLTVSIAAVTLWLDQRLILRLAALQNSRGVKVWAYSVYGVALLFTGMCVGCFRYWIWLMERPLGSLA